MTYNTEEKIKGILANIRKIREARKMSREALAAEIGASKDTVYLLEKGERALSLKWILNLSEALNCTISQLLGEQPFDKNQTVNKAENLNKGNNQYMVTEYMGYSLEIMNKIIDSKTKENRDEAGLLSEIYRQVYDIYEKKYSHIEITNLIDQKRTQNLVSEAVIKFLEQKIKSSK